jgi:3-phenylpropionate/cinnamic acid dioxygenase small subunit
LGAHPKQEDPVTVSAIDRDVRQDVAEVLVRYATGIDRKDWPLFRTCFAEDCHADYGDIGIWEGVDAITDYMARTHPDNVRTLHRITNVQVAPAGAGVSARSYVDVIFVVEESGSGAHAAGIYDDELVRTGDAWRIVRRRYTMVYMSPIQGS